MKTNIFLILTTFTTTLSGLALMSSVAFSAELQDISIVDVKSNIALSDEHLVYKDYYLNAGDSSPLRKNMVVNVKRKINIKDGSTKSVGDIETLVGQLKIIHIGNKVSVAREHKLTPRDEEPMLEQIGIMSGDRLDMTGSFIDNSKPNYKNKRSEIEPTNKADEAKDETKTADASAVLNPATTTPTEKSDSTREPANQLNTPPMIQQPIAIPQI